MPAGPYIGPIQPDMEEIQARIARTSREEQEAEEAERASALRGMSPEGQEYVGGVIGRVEAAETQGYKGKARSLLLEAGAPMNDPAVRYLINGADRLSDTFDRGEMSFDAYMRTGIEGFIQQGIISQTPYTQALQASGFGFQEPEFTQIDPSLLGSGDSAFLHNIEEAEKGFVVHPSTGWMQYKNGTLVDPNAPMGAAGAVIFDPSSSAPGSNKWVQEVLPKWSQEKINDWRETLIAGGYLSSESKKGGLTVEFINAMQQYQAVRYQNGGTPMDIGPVIGAAGGTTPYNFQQIRASIDEDVRNAWEQIYGTRPDEDEVQAQREMVIEAAKKLYKRGQLSPEGAAAEAEARVLGRMERSPEARFVTENVEENTELRDRMLRAVQVTSMMS